MLFSMEYLIQSPLNIGPAEPKKKTFQQFLAYFPYFEKKIKKAYEIILLSVCPLP
jgi:hypothetical protein